MQKKITSYSFSGISTFKSCPRAFKYRYIETVPEAFSSIEAHMGSSVHAVLEWAYKERLEGREPDAVEAAEQYKQAFWNPAEMEKVKVIKTGITVDEYFDQGKAFLLSYLKRIFPFDKSDTIYLEHRFEIDLSDEFRLKGVIDRVARDESGVIRVTDFKTGRVNHPLDNLQLPSYALYIFHNNIDNEIQLCIEDLREERTMVVPFQRKDVKQVRLDLLEDIRQIVSTEDFIAKPSMLCQWCGYNHICESRHESVNNPMEYKKPQAAPAQSTPSAALEGACPLCGSQLRKRKGKFGDFMGCTNYPQCRYTFNLDSNGNPETVKPDTEGKDICPECGSLLKERKGKYGDFMGCTNYPQCRYTFNLDSRGNPGTVKADTGENPGTVKPGTDENPGSVKADTEGKDICPECGSLLKERKGKYGAFMGCTSFPRCRFTRPV